MSKTYKMTIAGCERELPLCPVNENLDIAAFIMFGDVEITEKAAEALLKICPEHDVVVTDPPRAGMHEKVVEQLLAVEAPRIVYVSCNPATQARDLQMLSAKYDIRRIQPVDMFPHTQHVENVAELLLREKN